MIEKLRHEYSILSSLNTDPKSKHKLHMAIQKRMSEILTELAADKESLINAKIMAAYRNRYRKLTEPADEESLMNAKIMAAYRNGRYNEKFNIALSASEYVKKIEKK